MYVPLPRVTSGTDAVCVDCVLVCPTVSFALEENSTPVKKVAIGVASVLFKGALLHVCHPGQQNVPEMESFWKKMVEMKDIVLGFVSHTNDGIRAMSYKFMETVVLCFSGSTASADSSSVHADFSLSHIPASHPFLFPTDLSKEGRSRLLEMLTLVSDSNAAISTTNLTQVIVSCSTIARARPTLSPAILNALLSFCASLSSRFPVSDAKSRSVIHSAKTALLSLKDSPEVEHLREDIGNALVQVGAEKEGNRVLQPFVQKRKAEASEEIGRHKKRRSQQMEMAILSTDAFVRIQECRDLAKKFGVSLGQERLVVRMSRYYAVDSDGYQELLHGIAQDVLLHRTLALRLLYEEASAVVLKLRTDEPEEIYAALEKSPRYEEVLSYVLQALKKQVGSASSFTDFVKEVPFLTSGAFKVISSYCREADKVATGLNTMRALILLRIPARAKALTFVLEATIAADDFLRQPAIRLAASDLFLRSEFAGTVEEWGREQLQRASSDPDAAPRLYSVFMALCAQEPRRLFREILELWVRVENSAFRASLKTDVVALTREIISRDQEALRLILQELPAGTDELALQMLSCMDHAALTTVKDAVLALFNSSRDSRYIVPLLPIFQRAEIVEYLPRLIDMDENNASRALLVLFKSTQILPLPDLLISLVNIDPNSEGIALKKQLFALNFCFERGSDVFKQEVLALVLGQLLEQDTLTPLFMFIVHKTLRAHPNMKAFVTNHIMLRLVDRHVWEIKVLWEGFILLLKKEKPWHVYRKLPEEALRVLLLETNPELAPYFVNQCSKWSDAPPFVSGLVSELKQKQEVK